MFDHLDGVERVNNIWACGMALVLAFVAGCMILVMLATM